MAIIYQESIILAPFLKLGYIDDLGMILTSIVAGLVFGYILVSTGMGNSRKISAVFYGKDWGVMKVMFSAVVTTMILTYSSFYLGILDISLVQLTKLNLGAQIYGGLIFGAGMAIGGYCPGTAIAAGANRKIDALIFILGFMVGLWMFAINYGTISEFFMTDNLGKVTLSDVFNLSFGTMSMLVVLTALGTFLLLNKIEGKLYKKSI